MCNRKKSMTVSDNTIQAEVWVISPGKKRLNVFKKDLEQRIENKLNDVNCLNVLINNMNEMIS